MRLLGKLAFGVGLVLMLYCWLAFDISVSTGHGGRVVNLGLMSDRTNGVIVGAAIMVAGGLMLAFTQNHKYKPAPLPPPPMNLNVPLPESFGYPVAPGSPPQSFALWRKALEQHIGQTRLSYSAKQLQWGYSLQLVPAEFVEAVEYIEKARVAWRDQKLAAILFS